MTAGMAEEPRHNGHSGVVSKGGTSSARKVRRGQISSVEGIPALSLDSISSVAYGPQSMLVVLATAGAGALAKIEPITLVIVLLVVVLVFSYRQVIEAYPDGGGCYAVSKANLGARLSHLAAASLVVDRILTVAVSIAAGVQPWCRRSPT
jgi:amino acid transporter